MANARSFAKTGELKATVQRDDGGESESVKLTSSSSHRQAHIVKLTSPSADIEKWLQAQDNKSFVPT